MATTPKVPVFELEATGTYFKSKSNDIFGVLQTLEDKHSAVETARKKSSGDEKSLWKNDPSEDVELGQREDPKSNHYKSSDYRNKDSKQEFRKPYIRPLSHRKYKKPFVPDYKKHPGRYTCYSLDDVSSADMSDATNSRAAFDFLDERKKIREQQERGSDEEEVKVDFTDTACSKGAFTFKKQNKKMDGDTDLKTSKSTETNILKVAETEQDLDLSEVSEDIKGNNSESTSFKRRKTKQRNIRTRDSEDEDET